MKFLHGEVSALFESAADVQTIVDPKEAAESAGLRYVSDTRPGIRRRKSGKGFHLLSDGWFQTDRGNSSPGLAGRACRAPSSQLPFERVDPLRRFCLG